MATAPTGGSSWPMDFGDGGDDDDAGLEMAAAADGVAASDAAAADLDGEYGEPPTAAADAYVAAVRRQNAGFGASLALVAGLFVAAYLLAGLSFTPGTMGIYGDVASEKGGVPGEVGLDADNAKTQAVVDQEIIAAEEAGNWGGFGDGTEAAQREKMHERFSKLGGRGGDKQVGLNPWVEDKDWWQTHARDVDEATMDEATMDEATMDEAHDMTEEEMQQYKQVRKDERKRKNKLNKLCARSPDDPLCRPEAFDADLATIMDRLAHHYDYEATGAGKESFVAPSAGADRGGDECRAGADGQGGGCGRGAYCKLPAGDCAALDPGATAGGACVATNVACADRDDPVCGCDGVDYAHRCAAREAGVSVAAAGACADAGGGAAGAAGARPGGEDAATRAPTDGPVAAGSTVHEAPGPMQAMSHTFTVLEQTPHDESSFTQGLSYGADGTLFETTGLRGESKVRRIDPDTFAVERSVDVDRAYFGEGSAYYTSAHGHGRLIEITWQRQTGFIYYADTLKTKEEFQFTTGRGNQGWGITYDAAKEEFIVSDGSQYLYFWDRDTRAEKRRVAVTRFDGRPQTQLNELEFMDGLVCCNIWHQDDIICVDPETGKSVREYDMSSLWPASERGNSEHVLNGIALGKDHVLLTGKKWDRMYKVVFPDWPTLFGE